MLALKSLCGNNIQLITGELKVLAISVLCMLFSIFLTFTSILRLIDFVNLQPLVLFILRAMDFIVVVSYIYYCDKKLILKYGDLFFASIIVYPIINGILRNQINITYINDCLIFIGFTVKILVWRSIFVRINQIVPIDFVFAIYAKRIIKFSISCGVISFIVVYFYFYFVHTFYLQVPNDITFASALALGQGSYITYTVLILLALTSGKRMTIVGVGVMYLVVFYRRHGFVASLGIVALLVLIASILHELTINFEIGFIAKLNETYTLIYNAMLSSQNLLEFFRKIDPGRFVEYLSLQEYLNGFELLFGNGFGFRYNIDLQFLINSDIDKFSTNISNAHFTPLAIVLKFGIVGLLVMALIGIRLSFLRIDWSSYFQKACMLAFYSMIVQSLFAYSFFIVFFTPFYIAGITMGISKKNYAS